MHLLFELSFGLRLDFEELLELLLLYLLVFLRQPVLVGHVLQLRLLLLDF